MVEMKFSVITVSFMAVGSIERTIRSVISQDFNDFEYIIVDGGSGDGTVEIIRKFSDSVSKWISEPDSGIYEAMNKAVRMASGEFCIFMNAGDMFYDRSVLSDIARCIDGCDFLLGNQIYLDAIGRPLCTSVSSGKLNVDFLLRSSVCHQASFIRTSILAEKPYDESLKLVSDWKFALETVSSGRCRLKTVDRNVCFFQIGGATSLNYEKGREERNRVLSEFPGAEGKLKELGHRRFIETPYATVISKIRGILLKKRWSRKLSEMMDI